jgi:hypothetical protein
VQPIIDQGQQRLAGGALAICPANEQAGDIVVHRANFKKITPGKYRKARDARNRSNQLLDAKNPGIDSPHEKPGETSARMHRRSAAIADPDPADPRTDRHSHQPNPASVRNGQRYARAILTYAGRSGESLLAE